MDIHDVLKRLAQTQDELIELAKVVDLETARSINTAIGCLCNATIEVQKAVK